MYSLVNTFDEPASMTVRKPFQSNPIHAQDQVGMHNESLPVLTQVNTPPPSTLTMDSPVVATAQEVNASQSQVQQKKKQRRSKNTSRRSRRTIFKEMDETYKAKAMNTEVGMSRSGRVKKAVIGREVSKRNVYSWAKTTAASNLIRYRDSDLWRKALLTSLGEKDEAQIKPPRMSDRKQIAQHISQTMLDRISKLAQANAFTIVQAPVKMKGSYTPHHPSVLALVDMTSAQNLKDILSLYLQDSETVDGDTFATLAIPLAKAGSSLSVPVTITKFTSFLDNTQIAWKSVKGTRASTLRLYLDREGIHTGALQDMDVKVERFSGDYKMKMVVVHDNTIDMSGLKDVVTTHVENIVDTVAGRLRGMGLKYVE